MKPDISLATDTGHFNLLTTFKPVQHDVDLGRCRILLLTILDHHKPLAVGCDVVVCTLLMGNRRRHVR